MYATELRQQLGTLSNQMHAIVNAAKTDKNRALTSAEQEQFEAMATDYGRIEKSIEIAEQADKFSAANARVIDDAVVDQFNAATRTGKSETGKHAQVWTKYLRSGLEGLDNSERSFIASKHVAIQNAAQSTGTGSAGGYLVPEGFSNQLESALKFYGGILGNVDSFNTTSGNPFPWPTENDTAQMGRIVGQNVQVTNTAIGFGQVTFGAYIFSSDSVLVPIALLQDSAFDIDAFTAKKLGMRIGRLLNNKLTLGAGSGSGEPNGIVTAAVAAGLLYTTATGQVADVTFDDMTELEHAVDPAYRDLPTSKYMFADATLKTLKKKKDSANRPLWLPAALSGAAGDQALPTINNHPYIINNDMPALGAGHTPILFGDLSAYKVRRVKGEDVTVMRLVERYADYLQVGYIGFLRADGNLIDAGTHPVAVLQNAAS